MLTSVLSFLSGFGSLLSGPLKWVFIGLVVVVLGYFGLKHVENLAAKNQALTNQISVLQTTIKNQEVYIKQTEALKKAAEEQVTILNEDVAKIKENSKKVLEKVDTMKDQDRPSSDILKQTIKELSGQ